MSDKNHQIDFEKTQKFAQEVFSHLAGALVSGRSTLANAWVSTGR
jgi:hypothetical protein